MLNADTARPCLNCDAPLGGEFCARCGQRDIEPRVTVTEFAHEFAADHLGLDSKVARTLGTLIRHPGRLTSEFFAGRRIRYVPPLRLYISLSVLFFLLSAWTNTVTPVASKHSGNAAGRANTGAGDTAARAGATSRSRDAASWLVRDTLHDNTAVRSIKRRGHERLVDIKAKKPEALARTREAFRDALPDALFVLVPVLALMLALLYRGQRRSYAEHFVFALHFQAFVFAVFFLTFLPFDIGALIVMIAMPVYMFIALRAVYSEPRLRTMGKLVALGLGYVITGTAIMTVLGVAAILFG